MTRFITPLFSALCVLAVFISLLSLSTPLTPSVQIGLRLLFIYFLPGLIWTYVLWPVAGKIDTSAAHASAVGDPYQLTFVLRFILSLLLSSVTVPIGVLISNRLHAPISPATIYYVALMVITLGALLLLVQASRAKYRRT